MFIAKKVNENFFDEIDSEEKAYLLGFFMADGHLRSQLSDKRLNHMIVSLSIKDKEIVKYFQKYICPEATLQIFNSKTKYKGEYQNYEVCKVQWTSELMGMTLHNKYGITSNKSIDNSLTFPQIKEHLIRHFIRGFMDGDGTVRKRKETHPTINFVCTSEIFIKELEKQLLSGVGGSTYLVLDNKNRKTPLWRLYLFSYSKYNTPGNRELAKEVKEQFYNNLYNYLYKDANLYLSRKKERFDKIPC